jgi:hypothetical protein
MGFGLSFFGLVGSVGSSREGCSISLAVDLVRFKSATSRGMGSCSVLIPRRVEFKLDTMGFISRVPLLVYSLLLVKMVSPLIPTCSRSSMTSGGGEERGEVDGSLFRERSVGLIC